MDYSSNLGGRILALIQGGTRPSKISELVGIKPNALSNRLNRYQSKGIIIKRNGTYYLTDLGVNSLSRTISEACTKRELIQTIRKHNIRVVVPLRDELDNPQVFLGLKGVDFRPGNLLNVHSGCFDLEGYSVELNPRSALVILPDVELPEGTPLEELAARTWEKLGFILDRAQATLGIKFKRPGRDLFVSRIVSRHIAYTNHPLAIATKGMVKGIWVISYDEVDGKPRVIVDFSWKVAETEAVHKKHAPADAASIEKNLNPEINRMLSGEFRDWRQGISCEVCVMKRKEEGRAYASKVIQIARRMYVEEETKKNASSD